MKPLLVISILALSLLFAGSAYGKTFTKKEVLDIYSAAYTKMGGSGSLREDVDKSPNPDFKWDWEVHYLHHFRGGANLALKDCKRNSGLNGYSFVLYMFVDNDRDGQLDFVRRSHHIVDKTGTHNTPRYPDDLMTLIGKWCAMMTQEEAQAMYEKELEFWQDKLQCGQ